LIYSDITRHAFKNLEIMPMLKGRHDVATGIVHFGQSSDGKKDIVLGLYSRYLVRYSQQATTESIAVQNGLKGWDITEILKFDSAILAVEKGDIFGVGVDVLVVLTINSVHVIGPAV
jgi:hypothetical protein